MVSVMDGMDDWDLDGARAESDVRDHRGAAPGTATHTGGG